MWETRVMTTDGILEASTLWHDDYPAREEHAAIVAAAHRGEGGTGFVYQLIDPSGYVHAEEII